MEEYIRNNKLKINSKRTIDELLAFIIKDNGKIQAESNHNDDLVMSLSFTTHLLDKLQESNPVEMSQNLPTINSPLPLTNIKRYPINTNGGMSEEDLTWLMK